MIRRPPRSTRTYTLFPYTTLFRSYIDTKLHEEAEGGYTKTEYGEWDGTSFSSPAMSAIVGNVRLKYPEMSIVEVIELLSRTSNKAEISNESDTDDSSDSNSGNDENSSEELQEAPQCKEKGCGAGIADAYNVLTALDDRTNVHEGSIKHKYEGYNSLPEYKYLLELDKSTSVSSCDLYVARWGLLTQEYEDITHRVYVSTSDDEKLNSSNSNLQKIVDYPYSIIEAKPEERIGVQICEGSYCGEIFELDKPEDDIPVYCESYITD